MATTRNGYDFNEVISALQKCIRRNMEYKALNFALEAEDFNPKALWNRLKVIASEDVGYVNPIMPILIDLLEKMYFDQIKKDNRFMFLTNAVVCLCRSPHNRLVDDLYNVVKLEGKKLNLPKIVENLDRFVPETNLCDIVKFENKRLPIPDFALDGIHTKRCTKEGRETWDKLENETGENPYKEKVKKLRGY